MKTVSKEFTLISNHETELINITDTVKQFVEISGVESGMVFIMSMHTTTAITVNEGLPDIEQDIHDLIIRVVPDDHAYRHARYLHSDGQMAINAPSHLRGALLGFEVFFPVEQQKMVCGGRQTIYFVELDGPQERKYFLKILGE
jgi:secondary thiamine-phosphate synthase enzyme